MLRWCWLDESYTLRLPCSAYVTAKNLAQNLLLREWAVILTGRFPVNYS